MSAGTATYALLDAVFLAVAVLLAIVAAVVAGRRVARSAGRAAVSRWRRVSLLTGVVAGGVLVVATVVFDNVIVGLRIVQYDPSRILGLRLGFVPVEDLAYAIAAVLVLPALAVLVGPRSGSSR
jgi:lycopene cyclase domain-containing protein